MSNTTNHKSTESNTPRTDAQCKKVYNQLDCDIQWKEFIEFTRQLERELKTCRIELEQAKTDRNKVALQERQKYIPMLKNCRESALREAAEIAQYHADNYATSQNAEVAMNALTQAILAAISKGKK